MEIAQGNLSQAGWETFHKASVFKNQVDSHFPNLFQKSRVLPLTVCFYCVSKKLMSKASPSDIRISKKTIGFLIAGVSGLLGGILKFWLVTVGFDFGFQLPFVCIPIASPVAGIVAMHELNSYVNKKKLHLLLYLLICAIVGFIGGFLPFLYYVTY